MLKKYHFWYTINTKIKNNDKKSTKEFAKGKWNKAIDHKLKLELFYMSMLTEEDATVISAGLTTFPGEMILRGNLLRPGDFGDDWSRLTGFSGVRMVFGRGDVSK